MGEGRGVVTIEIVIVPSADKLAKVLSIFVRSQLFEILLFGLAEP